MCNIFLADFAPPMSENVCCGMLLKRQIFDSQPSSHDPFERMQTMFLSLENKFAERKNVEENRRKWGFVGIPKNVTINCLENGTSNLSSYVTQVHFNLPHEKCSVILLCLPKWFSCIGKWENCWTRVEDGSSDIVTSLQRERQICKLMSDECKCFRKRKFVFNAFSHERRSLSARHKKNMLETISSWKNQSIVNEQKCFDFVETCQLQKSLTSCLSLLQQLSSHRALLEFIELHLYLIAV